MGNRGERGLDSIGLILANHQDREGSAAISSLIHSVAMKIFTNDLADRSTSLMGPFLALLLASSAAAPVLTDTSFWALILISLFALGRAKVSALSREDWRWICVLALWPMTILAIEWIHGPLWSALDRPIRLLAALPLFFLIRWKGISSSWVGWGCLVGVMVGLALHDTNPFISVDGISRAQAYSGNPISYGQFMLVLGVLGASAWALRDSKVQYQILGLVSLLAGLGGVMLSGTRGVWLAAIPLVAFTVMLWWSCASRWSSTRARGFGVILVLTLWVAVMVAAFPSVMERASEFFSFFSHTGISHPGGKSLLEQSSLEHRMDLLMHGWVLYEQSPWIGVGAEALREALARQAHLGALETGRVHLHNELIQMLATYGLVGMASLVLFMAGFGWICWRTFMDLASWQARIAPSMSLQLILSLALFSLSDSLLSNMNRVQIYAVLLAVCAGACRHAQLHQERERRESQASHAGHCQA
jgi:O-antigen ligase